MRGGRLTYIAGALVLVAAAVVVMVVVWGDAGPPGRPSDGRGWDLIMGDGDEPTREVGPDPLGALEVTGTGFVGMAAEDDGTLWLLHRDQGLFRLGLDGTISRRQASGEPSAEAAGALALGPDGYLYAVTDLSHAVYRLELSNPDSRWELSRLDGLEDPALQGIAVGDTDEMYVADALGNVYSVAPDFDLPGDRSDASLVQPTPRGPRGCDVGDGSQRAHWQVGLVIDDSGELVVADPSCPGIYRPGEPPVPQAEHRDCTGGDRNPGGAAVEGDQVVVVGYFCRYVWAVADDGTVDVIFPGDGMRSWRARAVAADDVGTLYLLDEHGVSSFQLPRDS